MSDTTEINLIAKIPATYVAFGNTQGTELSVSLTENRNLSISCNAGIENNCFALVIDLEQVKDAIADLEAFVDGQCDRIDKLIGDDHGR